MQIAGRRKFGRAASVDIRQDAGQPDPEAAESIEDRMIARIDDDACLRADTNASGRGFSSSSMRTGNAALRAPRSGRRGRRQLPGSVALLLADAPSDTDDATCVHRSRVDVENDFDRIACLEAAQVVFAHVRFDPNLVRCNEGHQRTADGRIVPDGDLQAGDYAARRRPIIVSSSCRRATRRALIAALTLGLSEPRGPSCSFAFARFASAAATAASAWATAAIA